MGTPKKTASGTWRCQVYLGQRNGKSVIKTVTAATKRECADKALKLKSAGLPEEKPKSMTLGECVDRYIESSEPLSPTTLAGYRKIRRTMFADLMKVDVADLTSECVQKAINAEMRRKSRRGHNISAKSIKNAYGLVSASVRAFYGRVFTVKLPKEDPKFIQLPEPEFVLNAVQGSDIELQCLLAMWKSLSMSEIRGLKYSSIRGGLIYIEQVVVDVDGRPVEKKQAKVPTRNRVVACPDYIMQLIRTQTDFDKYERGLIFDDYLCPAPEYTVRRKLNKLVPGITFHQLRHMFASISLMLGVPKKYVQENGGWKTPHVLERNYEHPFERERLRFDQGMNEYFESRLKTNTKKLEKS